MRNVVGFLGYLYLSVVLNIFDHAHSRNIDNYDITERGAIANKSGEQADKKILEYLIFGTKHLDTIASIASETANFYLAVSDCCSGKNESETCLLTTEATNIAEDMEEKSFSINEIVRLTKNLGTRYSGALHDFKLSVIAMHRTVQALETLLESLDSNISDEMDKASQKFKEMYSGNNASNAKTEFITVETSYFNVLDKVLLAAVPNFAPIIPSIPKLQLFIKTLMGRFKTSELGQNIQLPDNSSERYQVSQSWFGKQISSIKSDTDKIQKQVQTLADESFTKANCAKKAFGELNKLSMEALKTYKKYAMSTQCKDAYDRAKKGVNKLRRAGGKMATVFKGVFLSRDAMKEAGSRLHKQLASKIFLNDLVELKGALEQIIGDGVDEEFERICNNISYYIDNIKNQTSEGDPTFAKSSTLISELRASLAAIPEYLKCYSVKARDVRAVLEGCKQGDGSVKYLNQQASTFYEDAADSCKDKIGLAPFSDQKLQNLINDLSKEQNFSEICEANNKIKASLLCKEYCKGSEKNKLPQLLKVPMKAVDMMMKSCKCEITGQQKTLVCLLMSKGKASQEILDALPNGRFTMKQIENIDCSTVSVAKATRK